MCTVYCQVPVHSEPPGSSGNLDENGGNDPPSFQNDENDEKRQERRERRERRNQRDVMALVWTR